MRIIDVIYKNINIDNIELDYEKPEFFDGVYHLNQEKYNGKQFLGSGLFNKGSSDVGHVLNLISDNTKFLVTLNSSFFHFISDTVGQLLGSLIKNPNIEFIFDTSLLPPFELNYIKYFISKLKENNVKFKIVKVSNYDSLVINNFYVDTMTTEMSHAPLVYDFFQDSVKNKNIKPFRKVYVSRKVVEKRINEPHMDRIDDHDKIEQLFKELGFEIINPEYFLTFEDQINYFYEVKTIASLTSSGLTNAIFMQPGQTMVELFTPLVMTKPNEPKIDQLHFYYHILATAKNHNYISFNNLNKKVDLIKDHIHNNLNLLRFLKDA